MLLRTTHAMIYHLFNRKFSVESDTGLMKFHLRLIAEEI